MTGEYFLGTANNDYELVSVADGVGVRVRGWKMDYFDSNGTVQASVSFSNLPWYSAWYTSNIVCLSNGNYTFLGLPNAGSQPAHLAFIDQSLNFIADTSIYPYLYPTLGDFVSYTGFAFITPINSGGVFVAWMQSNGGLFSLTYNSSMQPLQNVQQITNSANTGCKIFATLLTNGNIVLFWNDGSNNIIINLFDASGNAIGSPFMVNTIGKQSCLSGSLANSVATLDNGFVVAWSQGGSPAPLYAQLFDNNANTLGVNTQIDIPYLFDYNFALIGLPQGGFLAIYNQANTNFPSVGLLFSVLITQWLKLAMS